MAFCFCGVCIPVNAIWPLVLIAFKYIWDWFQVNLLGKEASKASANSVKSKSVETDNDGRKGESSKKECCKDCNKFPKTHFYLEKEHDLKDILLDAPCILKFTASWCKPCKKIEPLFEELSKTPEYGNVHFVSVDVDEFEEIQNDYHVLKIPCLIALHGEKEHSRISGSDPEKICEFVAEAMN